MACFSDSFSFAYRRCNRLALAQTGRQAIIRGRPKMVYYAGGWIPVSTVAGDDVSLQRDENQTDQLHVGNVTFNPNGIIATTQFQQSDTTVLPTILGPAAQV